MNDYWSATVSRLEHDELVRRARWDSYAAAIKRRRRAERRARRAERRVEVAKPDLNPDTAVGSVAR